MKKNKLILFDWGNIVESHLTGYSCRRAWNDLFISCGYQGDDVFNKLSKYKLSSITNNDEFEKTYYMIKKDFNLKDTYQEFVKKYEFIFDKIDYYIDVRNYEISLSKYAYIGILSNLTIFDKKRLDRQVGLDNYDYVFLSFEMGCKKPNIEIFEKVQNSIPFNKEDVLFIDDRIDNINMAKEFGWNTLQATGLELNKIKECCNDFLNR